MEGRWILLQAHPGKEWSHRSFSGPDLSGGGMPVVPCDHAAIERATRVQRALSCTDVGWHPLTETYAVYFWDVDKRGVGERVARKIVAGYASIEAAAEAIPGLRAIAALRAAGEVA